MTLHLFDGLPEDLFDDLDDDNDTEILIDGNEKNTPYPSDPSLTPPSSVLSSPRVSDLIYRSPSPLQRTASDDDDDDVHLTSASDDQDLLDRQDELFFDDLVSRHHPELNASRVELSPKKRTNPRDLFQPDYDEDEDEEGHSDD